MATDDKKTKTDVAPKAETATKDKGSSVESGPKTDSGEKAAATAPANYSRGEGQKPVTAAYKENWNAIFAKKKAMKSKR